MSSNAHGLYVQDDWTVAHTGLTINAGIRFDREYMPPYVAGDPSITFGWGSKIAPRIGGAYDLLHNGKFKVFASYGKYFDILKFSLPQGSFGGNYWHDCVYTLDNPNFNLIMPTAPAGADGFRHSCPTTGLAPGVGSNRGRPTRGGWRQCRTLHREPRLPRCEQQLGRSWRGPEHQADRSARG